MTEDQKLVYKDKAREERAARENDQDSILSDNSESMEILSAIRRPCLLSLAVWGRFVLGGRGDNTESMEILSAICRDHWDSVRSVDLVF